MTYLTSFDGTKIFYEYHKASGPLLVFLHGLAANMKIWKKEIAFFKKRGYSILYFDLRGHGRSERPEDPKKYRFEYMAKDIDELLKKEKIKKKPVLIGHSMGGMINLVYYKMYPKKVRSLILVDSASENILDVTILKNYNPLIEKIIKFIIKHEHIRKRFSHLKDVDLNKYGKERFYLLFMRGLPETPLKSLFSCIEEVLEYNVTSILHKIKKPVLIIEGSADLLIPPKNEAIMTKHLEGEEYDIVAQGYHYITIQKPKKIEKLILHFLTHNNIKAKTKK